MSEMPGVRRVAGVIVGAALVGTYVGVALFLTLVFRVPVNGLVQALASGIAVAILVGLTSTIVWSHKNKNLGNERWWDVIRASRPQARPQLSAWRWARLTAFSWLLMILCLIGFALVGVNEASQ